jgi:uncharacterized protein involved in response to NO
MTETRHRVLWARGFRPFFLLAGLQAVVALGLWLGVLRGFGPVPSWSNPFRWHAHEMIFGFAAAAIAGFLLTSVPVWTGRPALPPARLRAMTLLWVAGRLAVFWAGSLPAPWLAPVVDVAFLVALALAIGPPIYISQSRRNYGFPPLILVLAFANLLMHLEQLGRVGAGGIGERLGQGCVVIVITVMGGRLVPLFTANALKRAGRPEPV